MYSTKLSEDQAIIRYLLGDLDDLESEKIEERYFCDRYFLEHVEMLEDTLIDDYLSGSLPETDRTLFQKKYLVVPELKQKVAAVQALREFSARVVQRASHKTWRDYFTLVAPVFAALGMVFLIAGSLLIRKASLLPKPQRVQAMQAAKQENIASTLTQAPSTASGVLSVLLTPGFIKGENAQPRRLSITPGLKEIRLDLDIPGPHDNLTAGVDLILIEDDKLRTLWSRNGISSAPTLMGRTVVVSLNPQDLVSGDYIVYIRNLNSPTGDNVIESYTFSVIRP
jgi:hypothetical protein